MPYKIDPGTGLIDYDKLEQNAKLFRPKMIVAGISCYSRALDYKRFRQIANDVDAYLMADMAHISGLVAAGITPDPFEFCDIVTTTTHKTLRGPRSGIIFYRKGVRKVTPKGENIMYDLERRINEAVFPGLQGGPHDNVIAAVGVALKEANTPQFKVYQQQVVANCKALCASLQKRGYTIVSGGSDIHLLLLDLRPSKTEGAYVERVLEDAGMAVNKNTCPGDKSALRPSGLRLGTPALTSRNLKEKDMDTVAEFIHRGIALTLEAQVGSGPTVKDFKTKLEADTDVQKKIGALRADVEAFASSFPMPGHDEV
jgi:glycine hydroxymethyltransferase